MLQNVESITLMNQVPGVGMDVYPFSCGNIWQQAEAQGVFSWLAFLLAISQAIPKPKMLAEIYGRLNMSMVRFMARATMGRISVPLTVEACACTAHPFTSGPQAFHYN